MMSLLETLPPETNLLVRQFEGEIRTLSEMRLIKIGRIFLHMGHNPSGGDYPVFIYLRWMFYNETALLDNLNEISDSLPRQLAEDFAQRYPSLIPPGIMSLWQSEWAERSRSQD